MTDEVSPTSVQSTTPSNELGSGGRGKPSNRGGKRPGSQPRIGSVSGGPANNPGGPRPSSRASNGKKAEAAQPKHGKSQDNRGNKNSTGGRGGREGPSGGRGGRVGGNAAQAAPKAPQPAVVQSSEGGDALSSLQRVITDLKSISPPSNPSPLSATNTLASAISMHGHNQTASTLPANAPVFQPGAAAYPGPSAAEVPPRHRKSASLGSHSTPLTNTYSTYSPNLGSMSEDAEDARGLLYEDGEIAETPFQLGHQPRAQSQSYTAPRFAALAQQQQQQEIIDMGSTGRPQLAPNFMFGARRRGSVNPTSLGPAISEEDANFQFPQQQQINYEIAAPTEHRRTSSSANGGEIHGIMAEQIALQSQIEALQQQQQVLYQQQLASNQLMGSQFAPMVAGRVAAHRRVQSTLPVALGGAFGGAMGQFGAQIPGMGPDAQAGTPRGHGRRHSVNVVNKSTGLGASISYPASFTQDGYDDNFVQAPAMTAHSRQASRADSSWRMSKYLALNIQLLSDLS